MAFKWRSLILYFFSNQSVWLFQGIGKTFEYWKWKPNSKCSRTFEVVFPMLKSIQPFVDGWPLRVWIIESIPSNQMFMPLVRTTSSYRADFETGVTLCESWLCSSWSSVGEVVTRSDPYPDMDPVQVALQVVNPNTPLRLQIPSYSPPVLRELMRISFHTDPAKRPVPLYSSFLHSSIGFWFHLW